MTVHKSITYQCSLPTWEQSLPFSIRNSSPQAPTCFLSMQTFHLGHRLYQNIYYLLLCGDILENHFSFLDFITKNIMLDLNILRSVMEHWFSLKASYSSDHYNISWSNSIVLAHDIVARLKLKHIQVALLLSSREFSMY
jgi:hypothetical protein